MAKSPNRSIAAKTKKKASKSPKPDKSIPNKRSSAKRKPSSPRVMVDASLNIDKETMRNCFKEKLQGVANLSFTVPIKTLKTPGLLPPLQAIWTACTGKCFFGETWGDFQSKFDPTNSLNDVIASLSKPGEGG